MRKTFQKYMLLLLTVSLVGTGITLADTNVTILGDVNGDGNVDATDVSALVNYLHGSGTVNETAADVNRDGVVDIADVTAINNIISSRTFDKGTASTLFFPATTVGKTYGDAAFTNPIVRSGSTGDITYESSATGVATVNTTTGVVTITGAGTATITATLAGDGSITGATADYTLTVAQKALTITAKDQSIAYGNSIATGTEQVTANGLVDGDALTAVTLTASTDQVTTSGTITPSAAATTKGIENYNVTYTAGNLTVNKVAASVTTAPTGKTSLTYTGEAQELVDATSATCTGGTLVYSKTEDGTYGAASTITETYAGTYSFWYKVQGDGNHDDSTPVQVTDVEIAKKEVTVSGITAGNKTYDGTTTATLDYTDVTIDGKVGSDELTVTATGTFADANVGTGKTVTISEITLNGAGVANYKLAASGNQETTTADITAASFTPVVTLSGWTYGSPNIPSVGETNTSGGTVTYYYKTGDAEWTETRPTDVGTHQVKASIAANGNYAAAESAPVEFTITQASNSFTTQPAISNWTYGETRNNPTSAVVQYGNDAITYKYCATADGEYGTYESVVNGQAGIWYVKGFVEETTNYAAATSNAISFTIAQKEVTVSGITAENKTYDGTTTAALVCTGATITGKVDSDELTVTATGTFADANVGTDKTVTISGITLGGASAANYKLAASGNQESTTADITAVAATVTTAPAAVSGDLTYTGGALTLFNAGSVTGGTLKYKVTTSSTKPDNTNGFTTTIDQKTDAGTYYLWYYVEGDANHNSTSVNGTGISKSIAKAAGAATLSSESVAFGTSTADQTVTVSDYTGTVSANVTSGSGYCSVSMSGTTITISRTSSSAFSATVTVTIAAATNYNSATKTISVSGTAIHSAGDVESATMGSYKCAKIWTSASGGYYVVCSDHASSDNWSTACGYSVTQGGKTFKCGTKAQWGAIMSACGGTGWSYINTACSGVTGWSNMSGYYWSSTEYSASTTSACYFIYTSWDSGSKDLNRLHVRLVSAF